MKFYGRKEELERLAEISSYAKSAGYLTMLTGRRRVGKTTLVKHFLQQHNLPNCYFFISRKQPRALLNEFAEILSEKFPAIAGLRFEDFEGFFKFLFQTLSNSAFTFVLDEFQNFQYVDPAVFSILQKHWDENKDKIKGHIIVIGSVQTLMHAIFEDRKEPLYKRLTGKIILRPFTFDEMRPLFDEQSGGNRQADLELYLLFNGIPFYYYLMEKERLFGKDLMEVVDRLVLRHDGLLFNEGKELTIEELGANYGRYFSILEAIANGHTQWNNIATQSGIPQNSLGKYLEELTNYYGLIERKVSVFSQDSSKTSRYYLRDNFLAFWFRYVHKNFSTLEAFPTSRLLPKVKRDLPNFFGFQFEKFVSDWLQRQCLTNPQKFPYDYVGKYWDKGENEIDVVAYQENGEACLIGECKWNSKRITSAIGNQLTQSIEIIKRRRNFKKFNKAVFAGDSMPSRLRERLIGQEVHVFDISDYWGNE
jgi:hypothetical protein